MLFILGSSKADDDLMEMCIVRRYKAPVQFECVSCVA